MNELSVILQIFIITIIAVEGWWIWFVYPGDEHVSFAEFLLLELVVVFCLLLGLFSIAGTIRIKPVLLLPVLPLLFYLLIKQLHAISEIRYEEKILKDEIMKTAGINSSSSFERIGDIYFSKADFKNADLWYRKARSIRENPEIEKKIDAARKEMLIMQKKLWICPECSMTNSGKWQQCKYCGASRPSLKTLKKELSQAGGTLKRDIFSFIAMLVVVSIIVWFMKNAGFFMSFVFFSVLFVPSAIYFLYKFFSR